MNTINKIRNATFILAIGAVTLTSCTDDEETPTPTPTPTSQFEVSENITTNTTWETGNTYILTNRIAVTSGNTLIIQPGVVIKGEAGTGANATALLIARGAKIDAQGTETQPIIFTTIADEIEPGEIASPNLDPDLNGLWGGVIILGNAPISADADAVQIEGIPPSDQNGLYGGNNPADNSGILRYVSIRHGGSNIGEGNEINGLTLGGVGNGTIIEYIEIVANQDDGIEWFGGNVNVTNALVWNAGDDAIDTDQSWGGTLDNFIVINAGDECFELDGPEGTFEDEHTIINGTVYAGGADGLVDLDDNSRVTMNNIYFFGLSENQDFDQLPVEAEGGYGVFADIEATIPVDQNITDFFVGGSHVFVTNVPELQNTVGANATEFTGWTWASASGSLSDLGL
ncbi:hypothetical protein G3O08_05480 [Cryomorpha ignava]|uniref:T9SS C-terminal target domain-containing protein n=1 Tax=Cryomorpha ignava TaxID=101383 RepID=A0A7K3WMS6_9FLAO|nr:hypothetical protein [Cryomorpha ignava]NEN22949.1 hypothetical protein [Cryomorpha ignava]